MSESDINTIQFKKSEKDIQISSPASFDKNYNIHKKTDALEKIEKSILLVFQDGLFLAEQSDLSLLSHDILLCPFNVVVNWLQGFFIYVPANCIVKHPIHLKFQSAYPNKFPCYLRNTIVLKENSEVTLIEEYTGITAEEKQKNNITTYYSHSDTHIEIGENALLHYYKLQDESVHITHQSQICIQQNKASHATLFFADCGAQTAKTNVKVNLLQPHATCEVNGLYRTYHDAQNMHHHIDINHVADNSKSMMQFKGILDKKSEASFIGKVTVHKNTQHIQARQTNHHLLLSDQAKVNAKPELEIYADDLACSHGATVGQLDEAALFYLRSRGIEKNAAHQLLMQAFLDDILNKMDDTIIRRYITQRISPYDTV